MKDVSNFPSPIMDVWEWQYEGVCRDLDSDLFFHPEGERGPARRRRAANAKSICAGCPVMQECRDHALASKEPYGIWGGMTEEERRALIAEQRRAS